MIRFAPATEQDCRYLAPLLRRLDVEELRLTGEPDPARALRNALALSDGRALTAFEDFLPIAMFGITPNYMLGEAIPWMLGTDDVPKHSRELVKWARPVCQKWLEEFPILLNEVWVGNIPAVQFLKHIGFAFAEPRQNEYGAEMALFYMRRS